MNRVFNRITAVIVFTFIVSFLVLTVFREKGTESYQENRRLAELPEFKFSAIMDGSYTDKLGEYFSDHFAGRSYWISASGIVKANMGEGIVNDVFVTEDMLLGLYQTPVDSYNEFASDVNMYAENYDGTVYFAVIPTSAGVYSDRLPEYLSNNGEKQKIDTLYNSVDNSIRKIDAYNILKMLNDNYIYYRNDSKWTSYGAFCVYRTVIQKLGFLPSAYDKYTIEHVTGDFRGNLYNKSQYSEVKADILDVYTYRDGAEVTECTGYNNDGTSYTKQLYDKSYISTNDMYNMYLGEDAPLVRIKTSVNNERKLLVIKDSYADCFIPFLTQHYSEIAVISPDCIESGISNFVNPNDYEQTLILFGIEALNQTDFLDSINK